MAELLNEGEGVPLRLYYRLAPDHTASAEVIARASLAFISGIRELAYVLDPSAQVQIGLQGHTEGSLWEDLVLLVGKAKAEYQAHPARYGLALAALAWIMTPPAERAREIAWQPLLDQYLPEAKNEDVEEAKRLIEIASSGKVAVREKQQFYREIGRDTGIVGVSANISRETPDWIVDRSDFQAYSGQAPIVVTSHDRVAVGPARVIILSPVLEISTTRRWKFATPAGEFGAAIKDRAFLESIVAGQTSVRMRGGVELDVELESRERLVDGVWTVTERNVLRVLDISEPAASRQQTLFPE
ncbi:hypothetical protein EDF57_10571 [Novosphingobium sp. PhB55]|uniref:hypothetical protein n=1 Tax=Novosphingobium sp. PhB55 TaxID=2485106 RepID=UPI0010666709|nr:hypothetical protein [Novosphingobium sp. PhB55]TDW63600.1 hypothetical protein EDF57_10571 [Novosphingobium sp. PhB55]